MKRKPTLIILLCLALTLAIAGCGDSDDSSTSTSTSTDGTTTAQAGKAATDLNKKPKITVPDGGAPPKQLEKTDLVEGTGAEAKKGDEITVQYVGANYENGKEFDSSWDRGESFTFPLGAGEVIKGWDQGVEGMKAGGRRELIIPPSLAYGSDGAPPSIGPNETLIFVVDLVEIH